MGEIFMGQTPRDRVIKPLGMLSTILMYLFSLE